jgi:hypothetical protein
MKSLLQSYKMMSRRQAEDGDAPIERRVMNIDNLDLSPELREKAKACKTPEEMLALAKKEGYKLSDAEMEAVSGGRWDDSLDLGPM